MKSDIDSNLNDYRDRQFAYDYLCQTIEDLLWIC